MAISKSTTIEEIVASSPELVTYLAEKGIRCIRCGEAIWGTLEEAARAKGFSDPDIAEFIREMNEIVAGR